MPTWTTPRLWAIKETNKFIYMTSSRRREYLMAECPLPRISFHIQRHRRLRFRRWVASLRAKQDQHDWQDRTPSKESRQQETPQFIHHHTLNKSCKHPASSTSTRSQDHRHKTRSIEQWNTFTSGRKMSNSLTSYRIWSPWGGRKQLILKWMKLWKLVIRVVSERLVT